MLPSNPSTSFHILNHTFSSVSNEWLINCTGQDKHPGFHADYNKCITDGIWMYTITLKTADEDVGMKKAQKQDIIQNGLKFYTHSYTPQAIYNVTIIMCGM